MLLVALISLGSPSFILFAAAANQCFGADDGGDFGILYNAVRDYVKQDCANNNNCTVGQTYGWPMNSWCVGIVTDMTSLFSNMDTFNEDISGWDTSNVENMYYMFSGATSFNSDLSSWNISSVTTMGRMFYSATSFNGDLSSWDTSNVGNMEGMFGWATSFNSDLSSWDISSVTSMNWMFDGATSFNQDLCAWGDKFPYDTALDIFADSGCTFTDDPQEDQKGPFCASDCNGDTPITGLRSAPGVVVY